MRIAAALSLLGLIAYTSFAAPSDYRKKDVNFFLHESAAVAASKKSDGPFETGTYTLTSLENDKSKPCHDTVVTAKAENFEGSYIIQTPRLDPGLVAGRLPNDEDKFDSEILLVPFDGKTSVKWDIQPVSDGTYNISIGGDPLSNRPGEPFALPTDVPPTWVTTTVGRNLISIRHSSNGLAWTNFVPGIFSPIVLSPYQSDQTLNQIFRLIPYPSSNTKFSKQSKIDIKVTLEEL